MSLPKIVLSLDLGGSRRLVVYENNEVFANPSVATLFFKKYVAIGG